MSKFLYLLILRPANGGYQYLKHTSFKASLHQVTYSGKVTQKQYNQLDYSSVPGRQLILKGQKTELEYTKGVNYLLINMAKFSGILSDC